MRNDTLVLGPRFLLPDLSALLQSRQTLVNTRTATRPVSHERLARTQYTSPTTALFDNLKTATILALHQV